MKAYRLVTLTTAVLITTLLFLAFSSRTIIAPVDSPLSAATLSTTDGTPQSRGS